MKSGLKIFHWILILWLLIAVLRFELVIDYLILFINYLALLFDDAGYASVVLNFKLFDAFISAILFLAVFPLTIFGKKRINFLNRKISFSFAFIVALCFIFLFTPVISNENPEFSKNLSVTKLLPPFSSVKQLELNLNDVSSLPGQKIFKQKVDEIIKPSFNEKIIYADSVKLSGSVTYFQKNAVYQIQEDEMMEKSLSAVVKNKFFLLGTDEFGRDLFVRIIYGTRISLTVGFGAVVLSFVIGILLGFIAGYRGGLPDVLLNRFTEIFLAFPVVYLVVLILALFGSSIFSVIIVLGISGWMSLFKIVKSEVLSIKQKDFFSAAELVGLNKTQLLLKEILPVIIIPVLVNLVFLFSNVILAEAALSYLGLGTGSSYPSWGSMISSGQEYINKAWWMIAFPGLGLILTLFSINSAGKIIGKTFNPGIKD